MTAGREDSRAKMCIVCNNVTFHALYMSIVVGSLATDISVYVMLAVDFCINLLNTASIIYKVNFKLNLSGFLSLYKLELLLLLLLLCPTKIEQDHS